MHCVMLTSAAHTGASSAADGLADVNAHQVFEQDFMKVQHLLGPDDNYCQ